MAEMTSEQFALFLVEACKQPDIRHIIAEIASPKDDKFNDAVTVEVHRQIAPLKQQLSEKDAELQRLRNIVRAQQIMLDDLEQQGHRVSLRIAGIPENPEHDNRDEAVLKICNEMKVEPKVETEGYSCIPSCGQICCRETQADLGQICNKECQRTCVQGQDRTEKRQQKGINKRGHIYVNENLARFRAGLAKDARSLKNTGNILDI